MQAIKNRFSALSAMNFGGKKFQYCSLRALEEDFENAAMLPFCIKVLLESALRNCDGLRVTEEDVERLANWNPKSPSGDFPFIPARVVMQDLTGVPCIVDLAALREAAASIGYDPGEIQPLIPVDLVIDHSVIVDSYGTPDAMKRNVEIEFGRNMERYRFLKWAQKSFSNLTIVPPGVGIVHQVNLEMLSRGVHVSKTGKGMLVYPDSLLGTDSHMTMINGLGIVGWGVGGIEATAAMLGQPLRLRMPSVAGFRLTGELNEGVTATDLVLTITELLRRKGVVGKFVEFFGDGVRNLTLPTRATIANMAPECGCRISFFPWDEESVSYLLATKRPKDVVELMERYAREQGLFMDGSEIEYSEIIELDLGTVQTSLAGPLRPEDRVPLSTMRENFKSSLLKRTEEFGLGLTDNDLGKSATAKMDGHDYKLTHGSVVIAAITSCTNTSNPSVMIAAGLLAKKAAEKGLSVPAYVKTSLAPGSRVVTEYLKEAGLLEYLEKLRFHLVGYGCTTCIGNSGPLPAEVSGAIKESGIIGCAVLSGNRNFGGRIHTEVKANYLASPPLVVAFALAGRVDIDMDEEPIGKGSDGKPVYLRDIWPSEQEVAEVMESVIKPDMFSEMYKDMENASAEWNRIDVAEATLFAWDAGSTYIRKPPFFDGFEKGEAGIRPVINGRIVGMFADSTTTDHISPAGTILPSTPAGKYLLSLGVPQEKLHSYGARRGNHEVMMRGTFANNTIQNILTPEVRGSASMHFPDKEKGSFYDIAIRYKKEGVPTVILAGKNYGKGSSRDWAAKGAALLGIRAVIAESFESIHRSNLIGMGVIPLLFKEGENAQSLGITGEETVSIPDLSEKIKPGQEVKVIFEKDGKRKEIKATLAIETELEIEYLKNGGILPYVLKRLVGN